MKGITSWNYSPYTLLNASQTSKDLFISRIAPFQNGFAFSFQDNISATHMLHYREMGVEQWETRLASKGENCLADLHDRCDYEFFVERTNDFERSKVRLVHTGRAVGDVVNYLHPKDDSYSFSGRFLCSPSILVLPGGKILASMDVYAPNQAQNLTFIYESLNDGKDWHYVTELYPCFWGKMFYHQNKVYMLSMMCEYGDLLIGVSEDEGKTWKPPTRILPGSNAREIGPHKAPMPIISHNGRLFTAIDYGSWKYGKHDSAVLSIQENEDLLDSGNWILTEPLPFNDKWPGLPQGELKGCLEGNVVVAPNGSIVNILRLEQWHAQPPCGQAVILTMCSEEKQLEFDRVIDFPLGANSKFVILRENEWFIAIGNECYDSKNPRARNILSVAISKDLIKWRVVEQVIDNRNSDWKEIAFQYPDCQIVEGDLYILSRTAISGANSFHDSNMITFHKVEKLNRFFSS